jgi:hypothetical protein
MSPLRKEEVMEQTQFSIACMTCGTAAKISTEIDCDIVKNVCTASTVIYCPRCGVSFCQFKERSKSDAIPLEADREVKEAIRGRLENRP